MCYSLWTFQKLLFLFLFIQNVVSKKFDGEKPAWAKKDIRDYNEADLERLYDQWEVCMREIMRYSVNSDLPIS